MDGFVEVISVLFLLLISGILLYQVFKWFRNRAGSNKPDAEASNTFEPVKPYAPPGETAAPIEDAAEPVVYQKAPFRLAYANALGRLCDAEWQQLHAECEDILDRLKKATRGLDKGDHQYVEGLLVATLSAIRSRYGRGEHWLEAVVLSDLAMYCHNADKAEDTAWRFGQALEVAVKWQNKYPWLIDLCTAKRMTVAVAQKKKRWGLF